MIESGQVVGAGTVGANGYWSANVAFLNDDGTNTLSATDTDNAGNTGSTSQPLTYNVNTSAAAFTAGNLVISISGDGDGSGVYGDNQASPMTLEQITTSGTIVSQLVMPETTTVVDGVTEYAISSEYGSSSEGTLELSADGQSLVIAGYGVNPTDLQRRRRCSLRQRRRGAVDEHSGWPIHGRAARHRRHQRRWHHRHLDGALQCLQYQQSAQRRHRQRFVVLRLRPGG